MTNTRNQLLDVAQTLIVKHGLNAMSFQHLSDAVGIRKASVHYHFAGKAEMLHALLDRFLEQFAIQIQQVVTAKATGHSRLRRYCQLFVGTLQCSDEDEGCLCGILLAEWSSLDNLARQRLEEFIRINTRALQQILNDGVADGTLSPLAAERSVGDLVLAALEGGLLIARCQGGIRRMKRIVNQLLNCLGPREK